MGKDHPLRLIPTLTEGFNHPQPLGSLLAPLPLGCLDLQLQIFSELIEVDRSLDQFAHRPCAHIGTKDTRGRVTQLAILVLSQDARHFQPIQLVELLLLLAHQPIELTLQPLLELLLLLRSLVLFPFALGTRKQFSIGHITGSPRLERLKLMIDLLLQLIEKPLTDQLTLFQDRRPTEGDILIRLLTHHLFEALAQSLSLIRNLLTQLPEVIFDALLRTDLRTLHATQIACQQGAQFNALLLSLALHLLTLLCILNLDLLARKLAHIILHLHDDVGGEVEHPLQITRANIEHQTQARWGTLHKPDMAHW